MYHAAVLTVSDRVSRGERPDEGGPLVAELLKNAGYEVVRTDVVPDEQVQIEAALRQMSDGGDIQLLVTTGGTGFAPTGRDPGGHPCRVRPADSRHPGGHALCLHADHQPCHAVPGAGGHPEGDLDPEPPRLPQGG